tara:strand:+ start:247 stop:483 length:237 start_codon:yes stop_codon:yes gene_type:complete
LLKTFSGTKLGSLAKLLIQLKKYSEISFGTDHRKLNVPRFVGKNKLPEYKIFLKKNIIKINAIRENNLRNFLEKNFFL